MKIAAAYVRVSTDDQAEYSPDSQLKMIQDYAKRNEMIVPEEYIFIDEGYSAKTVKKRPSFLKMIGVSKLKPKPFDCILVYALSRFARNREDSVVYKRMLRKDLEIDVISITQDFGNDKTSILIEALLEAMDEYYSIDLGENVKRGMTEKATRGEALSIPALGYLIVNKKYVPDPETTSVVKMVFSDFLSGMGYRDIASKLNALGLRTNRGNPFDNRGIEYILGNPVYIGKIRWNPTEKTRRNFNHPDIMVVDGEHEPIIDKEVWDQAQERMAHIRKLYPKHSRIERASYMLKGLVKCSSCGATLTHSAPGSLQCHNYAKGRCSVSHSITFTKIDERVIAALEDTLRGGEFLIADRAQPSVDDGLLERRIQRENQKLARIKDAYENGVDSLEEYKINKNKILDKIAELETSSQPPKVDVRPAILNTIRNSIGTIKDESVSMEEKNASLRTFIDKIVFEKANNILQLYYYA